MKVYTDKNIFLMLNNNFDFDGNLTNKQLRHNISWYLIDFQKFFYDKIV